MVSDSCRIQDLKQLRRFVYHTLCDIDQLVPDIFPMTERILTQKGRPVGMYFCLHGPRESKFTAIWETSRNTVIFYDATGEKIRKVQLVDPQRRSRGPHFLQSKKTRTMLPSG